MLVYMNAVRLISLLVREHCKSDSARHLASDCRSSRKRAKKEEDEDVAACVLSNILLVLLAASVNSDAVV